MRPAPDRDTGLEKIFFYLTVLLAVIGFAYFLRWFLANDAFYTAIFPALHIILNVGGCAYLILSAYILLTAGRVYRNNFVLLIATLALAEFFAIVVLILPVYLGGYSLEFRTTLGWLVSLEGTVFDAVMALCAGYALVRNRQGSK